MPKSKLKDERHISEDVSKVGHWATGNTKFSLNDSENLEYAITLIGQSYQTLID